MGDTEYYNILEVEKTASDAEIKRAYKKKVMKEEYLLLSKWAYINQNRAKTDLTMNL